MPDGHFVVLSKAHTHAYVKSKSANMLASHLGSGLDPKNHTMGSRAKKKKEFELFMIAQIPSHKIGLSDSGSKNSQIQIREP